MTDIPFKNIKIEEDSIKNIDNIINSLHHSPWQSCKPAELLRIRFGFETGKLASYKSIGKLFGNSGNVIQRRTEQILKRLSNCKRYRTLLTSVANGTYNNDSTAEVYEHYAKQVVELEKSLLSARAVLKHLKNRSFVITQEVSRELLLARSIDELDLSIRTQNCLHNAKIQTIGDLVSKFNELEKIQNLGYKSKREIYIILSALKLIKD